MALWPVSAVHGSSQRPQVLEAEGSLVLLAKTPVQVFHQMLSFGTKERC